MSEPDSNERSPGLAEIIRAAIASDRAELFTMIPARIHKWDDDQKRAECEILIKRAFLDEEEERQAEDMPIITGVPVQFMGAGGFRIICPISDGTLVIGGTTIEKTRGALIWAQRSIDKWLSGNGDPVDPEIDHMHSPPDAIFVPGLRPFGAPWGSWPNDHMTIGFDTGPQIHCHHDKICIGDEAGSQALALANLVKAELQTVASTLIGHKHTGVVPGSGISGGSDSAYSPEDVAAEQAFGK